MRVKITWRVSEPFAGIHMKMNLHARDSSPVGITHPVDLGAAEPGKLYTSVFEFDPSLLGEGQYFFYLDIFDGALAHAVCYGLQHFEHVEREYLHGDLVAYGALVQLAVDGQLDKARELRAFLVSLGTPVTLSQMRVPLEKTALHDALIEATTGPDMAHIPYPVTQDMVFDAMRRVETL